MHLRSNPPDKKIDYLKNKSDEFKLLYYLIKTSDLEALQRHPTPEDIIALEEGESPVSVLGIEGDIGSLQLLETKFMPKDQISVQIKKEMVRGLSFGGHFQYLTLSSDSTNLNDIDCAIYESAAKGGHFDWINTNLLKTSLPEEIRLPKNIVPVGNSSLLAITTGATHGRHFPQLDRYISSMEYFINLARIEGYHEGKILRKFSLIPFVGKLYGACKDNNLPLALEMLDILTSHANFNDVFITAMEILSTHGHLNLAQTLLSRLKLTFNESSHSKNNYMLFLFNFISPRFSTPVIDLAFNLIANNILTLTECVAWLNPNIQGLLSAMHEGIISESCGGLIATYLGNAKDEAFPIKDIFSIYKKMHSEITHLNHFLNTNKKWQILNHIKYSTPGFKNSDLNLYKNAVMLQTPFELNALFNFELNCIKHHHNDNNRDGFLLNLWIKTTNPEILYLLDLLSKFQLNFSTGTIVAGYLGVTPEQFSFEQDQLTQMAPKLALNTFGLFQCTKKISEEKPELPSKLGRVLKSRNEASG